MWLRVGIISEFSYLTQLFDFYSLIYSDYPFVNWSYFSDDRSLPALINNTSIDS
jgi:hypothetical protein